MRGTNRQWFTATSNGPMSVARKPYADVVFRSFDGEHQATTLKYEGMAFHDEGKPECPILPPSGLPNFATISMSSPPFLDIRLLSV